MHALSGAMPYLPTPIDADGVVKKGVLGRLSEDLIHSGVHGLAVLGSTGEFAYLDREQKCNAVQATVEAVGGRVPVIAGVAATSIPQAARQAIAYQQLGVNSILLTLDAYFPLPDEQVCSYFQDVADAVDIPVAIYTNPSFQKVSLSLPVLEKLASHPRIMYLKEASTNTGRLLSIRLRCGDSLGLFAASSHLTTAVMMIGGLGWMSGPACLIPRQSVRLYDLCKAGRWDDARDLQERLWPINEAFAALSLAACIKAGLTIQGYDVGRPIAPQAVPSTDQIRTIERLLADVDGQL